VEAPGGSRIIVGSLAGVAAESDAYPFSYDGHCWVILAYIYASLLINNELTSVYKKM